MTDFNIQEDHPSVPFNVTDADGNVIFRDALTFPNMAALRNASTAERKVMMQERYATYLALVEELRNTPPEVEDPLVEE